MSSLSCVAALGDGSRERGFREVCRRGFFGDECPLVASDYACNGSGADLPTTETTIVAGLIGLEARPFTYRATAATGCDWPVLIALCAAINYIQVDEAE